MRTERVSLGWAVAGFAVAVGAMVASGCERGNAVPAIERCLAVVDTLERTASECVEALETANATTRSCLAREADRAR